MKLNHIPLLTFIGVVLSVTESQGLGFDHKDVHPCVKVDTKKANMKILQSYIIKTIPIDAVLFIAKNGIKICADPKESWVKDAIIELDKRAQNQSPKTESKKKVKKPAGKPKKPAGKKTQGRQKKRGQPSKKGTKVKSIRDILSTRTPAVKP
ncbi:lymphotactin-like [Eleutherodactylus coqui]|uniref:lymphotactin-like n=1 Tax=Eleutherodactylus coqui TaxID=57060 RepID=UPI00346322BA